MESIILCWSDSASTIHSIDRYTQVYAPNDIARKPAELDQSGAIKIYELTIMFAQTYGYKLKDFCPYV